MTRNLFKSEHLAIVYQQSNAIMKNAGSNRRFTQADLDSAGMEALVMAYESYDPSSGIPFESYAALMVHYAMLSEKKLFNNYNLVIGEEFADLADTDHDDIDMNEYLYRALDTLTAEELHLVEQRFGLNGYKRMKLRELSSIMNISNEAVNKRVKRIVGKLQKCA